MMVKHNVYYDEKALMFPNYKWRICPIEGFQINLKKRPCLWNRIWYKIIFGWKFTKL